MKFSYKSALGVLMVALVALAAVPTMQGCLGQKARDTAGVAAINLADDGVVSDARSGIPTLPPEQQAAATAEVDAFANAIASKDRAVIAQEALPRWTLVRSLAEAGITARTQSGAIGPGVAASLRERLVRFEEVLLQVGAVR
jgi:hypothetical protein